MRTESLVGLLPPGWDAMTLAEACGEDGGVQTGPFGSQLHASDYVKEGIPTVMPQNIGDNRIIEEGIARITPEDAERLSRYRLRQGDIIYSRRGDVERRALVREAEDGWLCGTGSLRVRFGMERVDPSYASYYLGHPSVRRWIVSHAVGATMANLNSSILESLPFVVPPIPEQRAIAEVLAALDDKIELNRRTNETLEAIARAVFESWFVDFDPVRAKMEGAIPACLPSDIAHLFPDSFENSELGMIPRGWRELALSTFVAPKKVSIGEEKAPEYSATVAGLSLRDATFKKRLSRNPTKNKKIERNDLVFGLSRRVLNFGVMKEEVGAVSPVYEVFKVDSTVLAPALLEEYLRMRMDDFLDILKPGAREGQGIDRSYFLNKRVPVPPLSIQEAFLHLTTPLQGRRKSALLESATLTALHDTLLPKLISGQIRIRDAERMTEATLDSAS